MKRILLLTLTSLFLLISLNSISQYSTCASAAAGTNLANGGCINNMTFPASVNNNGNCIGGSNPSVFISFVAGSCPQFTINPDFSLNPTSSSFGYEITTANAACTPLIRECIGNIVNQQDFTISGINFNGSTQLTSGTEYVIQLWGAVPVGGTIDICYNANAPESPSNECSGAAGLGTVTTTYFNGGDCSYNGTYDDTPGNPSLDPAAVQFCAGSLENTQWVNFSPIAGASSFQIIGTNINCTAGACAYQFGIFSGACGALVNEGCVANGTPCANGPDPNSAITQAGGNVLIWSGVTETGFTATISPASGTFNGTEEFYLAMDGNADAQCYYTLQGINVQTMPIELLSFDIEKIDNDNILTWVTASERDNDYFTIEHSIDAKTWNVIGKVDGAGTDASGNMYEFVHDYEFAVFNYYRLKQTDFNGNYEYFEIIGADNTIKNKEVVKRMDMMGKYVGEDAKGLIIEFYSDGTTNKIVR